MSLIPNGSIVTHIQCLESELNNISILNGQLIYTSDTNKLYWDVNDNRQVITDIIIITENEYNNLLAPLNTFYYISDLNKLMYYNGTNWILINENKQIWYGVCDTAAATQAKVVTSIGGHFKKSNGNSISIKFTYRNTVNNITLNIDNTGAANVVMAQVSPNVAYAWQSNTVVNFIYDGTNYCLVDRCFADTTNYGWTKLVDSVSNTSNLYAATPNAVNTAYTRASSAYTQANSAYNKANSTMDYAVNAYNQANEASATAQNAYNQANSAFTNANLPKVGQVGFNTTWTANGNNYEKTITLTGFTSDSQVDLTCNATTLQHLLDVKCKALYFENRDGTLYVVAVGNKPTQNIYVQYTMYTVS